MSTLEAAIHLALGMHSGQVDKAGAPYILHPLRVMMAVVGDSEDAQIVAVLHDVVEDTNVELTDLIAWGYSRAVVDAVEAITHLPNEPLIDYYARVRLNPVALVVKRADVEDNMSRIWKLDDFDLRKRLWDKYTNAKLALQR